MYFLPHPKSTSYKIKDPPSFGISLHKQKAYTFWKNKAKKGTVAKQNWCLENKTKYEGIDTKVTWLKEANLQET